MERKIAFILKTTHITISKTIDRIEVKRKKRVKTNPISVVKVTTTNNLLMRMTMIVHIIVVMKTMTMIARIIVVRMNMINKPLMTTMMINDPLTMMTTMIDRIIVVMMINDPHEMTTILTGMMTMADHMTSMNQQTKLGSKVASIRMNRCR